MFSHPTLRRCFPWPILIFAAIPHCLCFLTRAQTNLPTTPPATHSFLALAQGQVEIAPAGSGAWAPGAVNQLLRPGDRVRTGARSRAEAFLAGGMTIKLGASSELEIPPSPRVTLPRGIFQIFNRERFKPAPFRLPGGIAAIRGTDFLVEVSEEGRSRVSVLDGAVDLSNEQGEAQVRTGEHGLIAPGEKPVVAKLDLADHRLIQWSLYYPAILHIDDLRFTPAEGEGLAASLDAYRSGHLPEAFRAYPWTRAPASDAERCYRSALLLTVGQVEEAVGVLAPVSAVLPEKGALLTLISAVLLETLTPTNPPASSSEWLAMSYYYQFHFELEAARAAARAAAQQSPEFGFAWVRLAELEFGFGKTAESARALEKGLRLSPRNAHAIALNGFLLAARNRIKAALAAFDRAIELDSAYANAWLGRGLCRFRRRQESLGERDLLIAATLEPQRAIFRSYLGKAFQETHDALHANRELNLAKRLDAKDPTAWLYSALLKGRQNRINEAARDLERSQELNDQRSLFRSRLLLDQDRAVRGANLAAIYRDAGLEEVSVREAARAVENDYANFSAHLFLANSYNALRDPNLVSLRYETALFSEYILANLLSPIGGTPLSQQVSQQEYARLFEQDRSGVSSETSYISNGQWQQAASHYGVFGDSAYALEGSWRSTKGAAPNTGLDQRTLSLQLKQQATPEDSLYFQAVYNRSSFGDVAQHYDPASASSTLRNRELQEPNLFAGWHHQWSPGAHTLLLLARLQDDFSLRQPHGRIDALFTDAEGVPLTSFSSACAALGPGVLGPCDLFDINYHSEFQAYSAELQQIWKTPRHTVIAGSRIQLGQAETSSRLSFQGPPLAAIYFEAPDQVQKTASDLERLAVYAYYHWQVIDRLSLVAGLSFDHVRYPGNISAPPINNSERTKEQLSPKAGLIWTPHPSSTFRAACSRSLGGLFYESSVRLEPAQIAGFNQAYRSLAPESIVGAIPGSEFSALDVGAEHKLPSGTYLGWQAEALESRGERVLGLFAGPEDFGGLRTSSVTQPVNYQERSMLLYLNQLIGSEWSFGLKYRLSDSELKVASRDIPASAWPQGQVRRAALLQQFNLFAIYTHPSGIFLTLQGLWTGQSNRSDDAVVPREDFWQWNAFAGYRFARRQAEIVVGVLNLAAQDYRLNPVSVYAELPRTRSLFASLRFNF